MDDIQEHIFISEVNDNLQRAIVISGDDHSVWAYCMNAEDEQELLFHGFLCSRGTIVTDNNAVEDYIKDDFQPPLIGEYQNAYSIHESLQNSNFVIEWFEELSIIQIYINHVLYLAMDLEDHISYSKSIDKTGPYGVPLDVYIEKSNAI